MFFSLTERVNRFLLDGSDVAEKLTYKDILVLHCIAAHNFSGGFICYPGIESICRYTKLARSSVLRSLKHLQDLNILQIKKKGRNNTYLLNFN